MPLLPLPSGGAGISGGDLPVSDAVDVIAAFPAKMRRPQVAPVRDAFCEGFARGFIAYQDASHAAAGQCDPTRASGDYLRSFEEEHQIVPKPLETEEQVRARMFQAPEIVTPVALEDAISSLILPTYTMSELELDGLFIHDGTASVWDSFIGTGPNYPDRYYTDLPHRYIPAAVPSRGYPRSFIIHVRSVIPDSALVELVALIDSIKGQGMSWSLLADL